MKIIDEITESEILKYHNWKAWRVNPHDLDSRNNMVAKPDAEIIDLDHDWYLTYTQYTLSDVC